MLFNSQERKISFGLLLMRVGLAAVLLLHSLPTLFGGEAQWKSVGATLNYLEFGISLKIIGFVALIIEVLGAASLLSGFLFRTFCGLLTVLYGFYCFNYFSIHYRTLTLFSLALAAVYLGLFNSGPGKYALAVKLEKK
jgi:putative oxidoreductase